MNVYTFESLMLSKDICSPLYLKKQHGKKSESGPRCRKGAALGPLGLS